MAEINIERRRRPGLWPWLIGLVVLALLIWAIAELVNTDHDHTTMAASADSTSAASAAAPGGGAPSTAAAPPPPGAVAAASEQPGVGSLGALVPLGVQDVGQRVAAGGTTLSAPAAGGFWLRSDANVVLWVKSDLKVKAGQDVPELVGTLEQPSPGAADGWLEGGDVAAQAAKHADWRLTTDLYLDTSVGGPATGAAGHGGRTAATAPTRARRRR